MSSHLAVDAGNSKTVAVLVDHTGAVLGRGRGGCGDIYGAKSPEDAVNAVVGAIGTALGAAGVPTGQVASAALRLAGVDFEEDAEFWCTHLRRRFPELGSFSVKNDAYASLRLIDGSGTGVSITVGTGPAVAARAASGREECSGMFVFDDLGGQGLGRSALEAVCRAWMGLGPPTSLTRSMLAAFEARDGWELRHLFVRRFGALPPQRLWGAARLVLAGADEGDAVAQRIVEDQARAFARYAGWCAERVGVDLASGELPVLLNGSVATSESPAMRTALVRELQRVAPAAAVRVSDAPPLAGVVLDALAEGGVSVDRGLLAVIGRDHPEEFLLT
ncbi:BadF-type ATPase [Quadrisphaera granulorum]|uniref:N-acetylglucosamine kinase-like BadF-type ATPase n=1 Tax=Quadrisphaera granulorum TaxID=317664 RepID=A0A315ZSB2_9ACTN|nr:BadF/BadG/BcrA/BcrD ATPase family protein [Quadrisphaera granulorum]PWJ47594.1 N-acetylglucosamine kinase-like BadF-type ATPase [Quadrisphaera granulorum]SZE98724.1 BadF-type ATPase [Quadrisphaera granulorum]